MLVFCDESEWPRPKDPTGFTILAAAALHPSEGRAFFSELFALEKKFWKVTEPYEWEIKGRLLLSRTGVTSPKKREFCEEVISLCKQHGLKAFAIGLKNANPERFGALTEPLAYRAYSRILERVEIMMEEDYPDEMAIVALDSQDVATDTRRALAFSNFLYGSTTGRSLTHIPETPFFVSSVATPGIQIADLIAYALAQQNLGRTDIDDIGRRIRELEWRSSNTEAEFPRRGFRFEDLAKRPNAEAPGLVKVAEAAEEIGDRVAES